MTIRSIAILLVLISNVACVRKSPETVVRDRINLTEKNVADIKEEIKSQLKDPDSAKFGSIGASKTDNGSWLICGYVNSKNSFGGYAGQSPFVMFRDIGGAFNSLDIAEDGSYGAAILSNCRAQGVAV